MTAAFATGHEIIRALAQQRARKKVRKQALSSNR